MASTLRAKDLRAKDLPKNPEPGVSIRCGSQQYPECDQPFSADRRDYWDREDEPMTCAACGGPMRLVRKVVRFEPVRKRKAG
jgi:hypothetical protein